MSGRKSQLNPYHIIVNGDMSGNITSASTNIQYLDNVGVQLSFTGTPTGTFTVDGSIDNTNWIALSLTPSPVASGVPDNILIDMNQLSFPYVRIRYVSSSGTGTLNGYITAKQV